MSLRCEAVRAGYNGREVLAGVDLAVRPGEWVAVVGPNGSGKSTLLRRVAGLLGGDGNVSVNGRDPNSVSRREAARLVALVPQNPVIPDGISVLEYVGFGRTPYVGSWSFGVPEEAPAVRRVLRELDLAELAHRALSTLSGGELQRAVLGRALAQEAAVLLLDEPTTALDLGHAQDVMELVDGRCRRDGIAVLSAIHDLTLAAQFCDRLMLLAAGAVAAEGSAREVITRELLASHFEAEVVILDGPSGEPVVVPRSR